MITIEHLFFALACGYISSGVIAFAVHLLACAYCRHVFAVRASIAWAAIRDFGYFVIMWPEMPEPPSPQRPSTPPDMEVTEIDFDFDPEQTIEQNMTRLQKVIAAARDRRQQQQAAAQAEKERQ